MGQKMAQGTGLTAKQKQLLDLAVKEPYILKTFYLSGGTALSYWYLYHRQSDDLDFFSLLPFDYARIVRWIRHNKENSGCSDTRFDEDYGFLMIQLQYPDSEILKIDFHHYTTMKLTSGILWHGLEIDSLTDIAVNKVRTIATLPRTRDYIDLFCIMKRESWTLDDLIIKSNIKFKESIDLLQLVKNFLKVSEYTDFPIMHIPFYQKDMYEFYEDLARSLKSKILK